MMIPIVVTLAGVFAISLFEFFAEDFVGFFTTGKTHQFKLQQQITTGGHIVEGRNELAIGQVTRSAKDDDGAGFCAVPLEQRFLKGVFQIRDGDGDTLA